MVKITYKGKSREVPATYLKGLKGKERQAQINAARAALAYQTQTGEGSGYTGGFDPSTQNYDDPFDPGQTE